MNEHFPVKSFIWPPSTKLYFYDTGLACSLLGIRSPEGLRDHFAYGALFENFIIAEVLKNLYNQGIRPNLYFWRDHAGHEIDLLVEEAGKLIPVEIKAAQAMHSSFFKGLNFFNSIAPASPQQAYLIYDGDQNYTTAEGQVRSWNNLPSFE